MALRPGEDLAATLYVAFWTCSLNCEFQMLTKLPRFADIHYFYGPPTSSLPHHRFNKESYVYLFENPAQRRARVEIANNAGTADQDAFDGCMESLPRIEFSLTATDLDGVHVVYSYKRTTLVTLTVESPQGHRTTPLEVPEWHLPTYDPKNEHKYMYKLHTIDIYFWAKEDALLFVNAVRRLLPQQQVTVLDEPVTPAAHRDPISPVVQKLENVAVSDPSYQNGQTRDSRSNIPTFAGPPMSALPQTQTATFTPVAYNPAAPAAPEKIQHREKTPPPEDGAANPLVAAASADQHGYTTLPGPPGQPPSQSHTGYFPQGALPAPPNQRPPTQSQSPFAHHFQNQFAAPPTQPITSPLASPPSLTSSPSQQQQQQQFTSFSLSSPGPGASVPGSFPQTPQPQTQTQTPPQHTSHSQAPPGGYSNFSYESTAPSNTRPMQNDHSMHGMVYRPTETESTIKHNEKPTAPGAPPSGRLEARAGKIEKGVGGFLKKLEKKYG